LLRVPSADFGREKMKTVLCSLMTTMLLLTGCQTMAGSGGPPPSAPTQAPTAEKLLEFIGTVVFVPLEGGFYGIVGEDGRRYDPINLADSLRKDGLKVRIKALSVEHGASFHMWGQRIEIVEISIL
jgi:hypothetical protein